MLLDAEGGDVMDGDLERRISRLHKGDHLCLVHDHTAELPAVLTAFIKTGLAAGQRCLLVGPVPPGLLPAVDGEALQERGALVVLGRRRDWLPAGGFDPEVLKDLLRQVEQQALDDGYSGLRIAWDLAWLLGDGPGTQGLIEFEARLNGFLAGSRTSALCLYPQQPRAGANLLEGVLRTHPLAVLGSQVCRNPYYEPPEMALGDRSPQERVDWMIGQIQRARVDERALEEVTVRLAQEHSALERANRAKEELLAMLAHELRNPLGTISNALQILRLKGGKDATWQRALDAAERQVRHQSLLVDDLLEAARVTRGEIELHCEVLDLTELVRGTVEGYRESLRNAGLAVSLELPDTPLPVRGDRLRLSQVLSNLLHNATKFTAPGGAITVRVAPGAEGTRAEVAVRDTGAGISPEVLPHVFEVFTQADDSLDRARGGLGVGLAVVKGLVELHGGEVRAASPGTGRGAEFTLGLPLLLAPLAEEAAERDQAPAEARRILVVEDNPDAAAMLRDYLELSGHEVELANSGTDGVEAARSFHPEVVLCDLGLPGMDGFEVAAELRRDPSTSAARLIAVTGYGRDEDRRRSKEAGFDLHLTKPVDPAQLRAVLSEAARPAAARNAG